MFANGRYLAAPEGDAGGGGAPAPVVEAPAAPAPQPDYAAQIQAQAAELQRMQQMVAMQQQQLELARQPAPQPQPEEDEYMDPGVKKQFERLQRQQAESQLMLQDQLDQQRFVDEVRAQGFDNELATKAAALHTQWLRAGMRVGNMPPSRIDALVYVAGQEHVKAKQSTRTAAQKAELERIAQNQDAQLGAGGARVSRPGSVNLETMDRKQRLATGYAAVLDVEGF